MVSLVMESFLEEVDFFFIPFFSTGNFQTLCVVLTGSPACLPLGGHHTSLGFILKADRMTTSAEDGLFAKVQSLYKLSVIIQVVCSTIY